VYQDGNGSTGFTLLEQEQLDKMKDVPWEELVKQSRMKLVAR